MAGDDSVDIAVVRPMLILDVCQLIGGIVVHPMPILDRCHTVSMMMCKSSKNEDRERLPPLKEFSPFRFRLELSCVWFLFERVEGAPKSHKHYVWRRKRRKRECKREC